MARNLTGSLGPTGSKSTQQLQAEKHREKQHAIYLELMRASEEMKKKKEEENSGGIDSDDC